MREQSILRFIANERVDKDHDYNDLIDQELIDLCRKLIRKNLVTLKDVPFELGNTIANMYYKLLLMTKINYGAGWCPKFSEQENDDPIANVVNFRKSYDRLKIDIKSIPEFLNGLREIDRYNKPEEYNYCVEFIIDCLKYDISNIGFKGLAERSTERERKKENICEIINLVYMLDV